MELERLDLPRESTPPPELRSRIAAELRDSRRLRSRRRPAFAIAAVLAVIAIAAAFFALRHPSEPRANYILLLYESPQFQGGNRAEYSQWARQMRPAIVGGDELDKSTLLAVSGAPQIQPAGYFLIAAPDDASAERVARACPHLRHGGAIVSKRIIL